MTASGDARPRLRRGVYLLTDRTLCGDRGLTACVAAALGGGVVAVQYRDKTNDRRRRRDEAAALAELCRAAGATFVVNDDAALAAEVGADGVHVGRDDVAPRTVRQRYGPRLLVGVSCYDELARAESAIGAGADYVAFGSAYPSPTKPGAVRAPLSLYRTAAASLAAPVVAIGGITPENAAPLVAAGCHAIAVISAVLAAADPADPAGQLAALFAAGARRNIDPVE